MPLNSNEESYSKFEVVQMPFACWTVHDTLISHFSWWEIDVWKNISMHRAPPTKEITSRGYMNYYKHPLLLAPPLSQAYLRRVAPRWRRYLWFGIADDTDSIAVKYYFIRGFPFFTLLKRHYYTYKLEAVLFSISWNPSSPLFFRGNILLVWFFCVCDF